MMMIAVYYQLLMFIGDPILLSIFKIGDKFLDLFELGYIFIGHGVYGYFIFNDIH